MRTGRNQPMVSGACELSGLRLAALLVAILGVAACAGRQRPITQAERGDNMVGATSAMAEEPRTAVLQFDNQAAAYVDVYLVNNEQRQWRLGRVPPGMRAMLRVPESAADWTPGFVQLAVIPGSQISPEAWRDPKVMTAIAQPVSEVLSQRWTFRQPGGAAPQLQATRLSAPR